MYSIIINKAKKALIANLSGSIDVKQANIMLEDFKKNAALINSKEYILIINPESLSTSVFVIPVLQSFIYLIEELQFKVIYLVNSSKFADIIKNQLKNTELVSILKYAGSTKEVLNKL